MPQEPEPLYTDADGVPTLFDVVLPGDVLRRNDYRLPVADEAADDRAGDEDAIAILQGRLQEALRAVLPDAVEEAIRQRRRNP